MKYETTTAQTHTLRDGRYRYTFTAQDENVVVGGWTNLTRVTYEQMAADAARALWRELRRNGWKKEGAA